MRPIERPLAARDPADRYDVVIVGSGVAGARAAAALRESGFAGSLLLVGENPVAPQGGAVSASPAQSYLLGSILIERTRVGGGDFWNEQRIDVASGLALAALDARARRLTLADGRIVAFGRCIVAAGAGEGVSPPASRRYRG